MTCGGFTSAESPCWQERSRSEAGRTTKGIARQRDASTLELLDLPHHDIGDLLRDGIAAVQGAAVIEELQLEDATILAPVQRPSKVVIAGGNYIDHVREANLQPPERVPFVVANGDMVIGPHDDHRVAGRGAGQSGLRG